MSAPGTLRIKRKLEDAAPDQLVVERAGKRLRDKEESNGGDKPARYIRQKTAAESHPLGPQMNTQKSKPKPQAAKEKSSPRDIRLHGERWVFQLKRPTTPDGIKKRKVGGSHVPTLVERKVRQSPQALANLVELDRSDREAAAAAAERPQKRPGRSSAMKPRNTFGASTALATVQPAAPSSQHLEAMARLSQQVAEEEAEKEAAPKKKLISVPKLAPTRSRDLHRQNVSNALTKAPEQRDEDVDMDAEDDAGYVYETYVLAPSSAIGAAQVDAEETLGEVGYLIITDEDQDVWESFIEDEPSDKDWNTDEEDENAEDWYGADYPDEELASDDEHNRGAYGYRAGGSDDEEWDEDTGAYSDDEYERQMQPWRKKTTQQSAKFFGEGVRIDKDEE